MSDLEARDTRARRQLDALVGLAVASPDVFAETSRRLLDPDDGSGPTDDEVLAMAMVAILFLRNSPVARGIAKRSLDEIQAVTGERETSRSLIVALVVAIAQLVRRQSSFERHTEPKPAAGDGTPEVDVPNTCARSAGEFFGFTDAVGNSLERASRAVGQLATRDVWRLMGAALMLTLPGLRPRDRDKPAARVRADVVALADYFARQARAEQEIRDEADRRLRALHSEEELEHSRQARARVQASGLEQQGGLRTIEARLLLRRLVIAWHSELRLQRAVRDSIAEGWTPEP